MSETEGRPQRGLARDIHTARVGAQATAEELRAYVREFRGKSPQEMLGLVAESSLIQATILATIITVVLMGAFTVGPYLWNKANPPTAKAAKPAAPAAAQPAAPAPAAASATAAAPAAGVAAPSTTGAPTAPAAAGPADPLAPAGSSPDVLNRLGIGETKPADPKKNPLDAGADDLLKDLK